MKALELATLLESDTADELLCQAYCDHMIDAAAELRRLAAVEADCAPYLKEGETPAERIKRALGDADSLMNLYRDVMAERDALKAERDELRATEAAWRKLNDTLLHQVLCCGVAASHPDATLATRGAYAGKWNSKQAEAVRALRDDRDSLRAELQRINALEPFGYWHQGDSDDESDFFLAGQSGPVGQDCPQCIALYALGSKT